MSITPAFFAAGCCATAPLMVMFGFSVSEWILWDYRWLLRFLGLVVFVLSLYLYFRTMGVTSKRDYLSQKDIIVWTTVQTALYSILIYAFLVYVATPQIMNRVSLEMVNCCGN